MSCWTVLGIKPTKNTNKIKSAYIELSKSFIKGTESYENLENAYNKAISLATTSIGDLNFPIFKSSNFNILSALINSSMNSNAIDSVEKFIKQVNDIYIDPQLRFNKDVWVELLTLPILNNQSLADSLEDNLLRFLYTHKFLPNNIYTLLNSRFNWTNRIEELKLKFSLDLIDFIVNSVKKPLPLTYKYLSNINSEELDEYLELREKAFLTLQDNTSECNKKYLFDAYSIYTKDLDLLKLFGGYYLSKDDKLMALNYFREAINIDSNDLYCLSKFGHLLTKTNQYSKAIYYFERYIKKLRNNIDIDCLIDLAYCYYYSYDLKKARDLFIFLTKIRPWDLSLKVDLESITNKISNDNIDKSLITPIYKKYLNPYLNPFINKLDEIYNNFSFRINEEKWSELFKLPIASNDTLFYLTEEYLIDFITTNKNIPKSIFIFLNNHFKWLDRHDELISIYPHLNINLLFNKLTLNENLSYDSLKEIDCTNLEEYVELRALAYDNMIINSKDTEDYLNSALSLFKGDFELYKLYGEYYLNNNMYDKAIENFKTVLLIKPDEYYSCCSLGVLLTKTRNYGEALKYLQQSVNTPAGSMLFDNEDFLIKYAICYYYTEDLANAKKYFKKLLKINPNLKFIDIYLKNISSRQSNKKKPVIPVEIITNYNCNTTSLMSKPRKRFNTLLNKLSYKIRS